MSFRTIIPALAIIAGALLASGCGDVRSDVKQVTYTQPALQPMTGLSTFAIQTNDFKEAAAFRSLTIPSLQQTTPEAAQLQVTFISRGCDIQSERIPYQCKTSDGRIITEYRISVAGKMVVEMKVVNGAAVLISKDLQGGGKWSPSECSQAVIDDIHQQVLSEVVSRAQSVLTDQFGSSQKTYAARIWSNQEFEDFELAKANALSALDARERGEAAEAASQWELAIPRWKAIIGNTDTGADGKPRYKDELKAAAANNLAQAHIWLGKLEEALTFAQKAVTLHNHSSYRGLPDFIKDLIARQKANPGVFK